MSESGVEREWQLHAVVVTFRRPDVVRHTVSTVTAQSCPPDTWTVVDNDPSEEAETWALQLPNGRYVAAPENLGPAGGIAEGLRTVLRDAADDDFVVLVDDDDPPPDRDALRWLLDLHESASAGGPVAGTGLTGARFDARRGLVRRVLDHELGPVTDVDFIGGNQLPVYSVRAVRAVGVFDASLFFGCEELEYGLRLRAAGWRLVVGGPIVQFVRRLNQREQLGRRTAGHGLASWRRYYSARNLVVVTRRYGGRLPSLVAALHAGPGSGVRSIVRSGRFGEAWMAVRGAFDGLRGRVGRVFEPPR